MTTAKIKCDICGKKTAQFRPVGINLCCTKCAKKQ